MLTAKGRYGMGWIPDYPDFRDYTEEAEEVKKFLMQTQLFKRNITARMEYKDGVGRRD